MEISYVAGMGRETLRFAECFFNFKTMHIFHLILSKLVKYVALSFLASLDF